MRRFYRHECANLSRCVDNDGNGTVFYVDSCFPTHCPNCKEREYVKQCDDLPPIQIDDETGGLEQPQPLFTRTAYSVAELTEHIASLEMLGLKHYEIERDVEVKTPVIAGLVSKEERDRWIIKVYEEETK